MCLFNYYCSHWWCWWYYEWKGQGCFHLEGGGVVEDAVVAIISYEIGICHLFSGLKVEVHCEGKPVK